MLGKWMRVADTVYDLQPDKRTFSLRRLRQVVSSNLCSESYFNRLCEHAVGYNEPWQVNIPSSYSPTAKNVFERSSHKPVDDDEKPVPLL
jgi:hypothetical protein